MLRIRMVEETIADRYAGQEMRCPVHLSIGQEGVAVGVSAALQKQDYVMSTHRCHAHYLAKGGDLKRMIAEIYGKETGCTGGFGGSMHLIDLSVNMLGSTPIVGSCMPVAVGTAFGSWLKGEKRVSVLYFGEGTTEEGTFLESLNFAALKRLPVIFVCENNLYSVYSPMSVRQPERRNRLAIAKAHGMEGFEGDWNQVEEVTQVTREAVERAREGLGPSFLEFSTYRWREHCGPNYDNDIGYRTEDEFFEWKKRCPIETFQKRLMAEGVLNGTEVEELKKSIRREIDDAFDFAKKSPFPSEEKLLTKLYA